MTEELAAGSFVSQYPVVYCDRQGHEAAGLCRNTGSQHGHAGPRHGTRARLRHGR